jgi:hypothetical protein
VQSEFITPGEAAIERWKGAVRHQLATLKKTLVRQPVRRLRSRLKGQRHQASGSSS